ncbi:sulfite exporter TauE/SafE family protein [Bacillaceae bacterium S4-13-58]
MEITFLSVLSLGFILGIKHAVEPDHVIAVSTIASQSKKLWKSALSGVFWGIGHTATIFIVGIVVILLKGDIPDKWAMSFEFLVGIMLVFLGITSIFSFRNIHVHKHKHDGDLHKHVHAHPHEKVHHHKHKYQYAPYIKSTVIGFVHGLAGSAAMILLTMSTANTVLEGAIYILVFGAGTIMGMLFFTTIIGIPFVLSSKNLHMNKYLIQSTGVISMVFGFYYMYNLGITEGLFQLWFG